MIIPVYESQVQREVLEGPLRTRDRGTTAPIAAFGGAEGAALERLGNTLAGTAAEFERELKRNQDIADDAAVLEASNRWGMMVTDYFYNPETGLMRRQMKGAKGASEEAEKFFEETGKGIGKSLENDHQRDLFQRYVQSSLNARRERIARHEMEEFGKYRLAVTQGAVQSALAAIAADPDETVFKAELDRGENALLAYYRDEGEEEIAEKVKEFYGLAHETRLELLLERDPKEAEEYFKNYRNLINPKAQKLWSEKIGKETHILWIRETADRLAETYDSEGAALRHVRTNLKGDKVRGLATAVRDRFAEKRLATGRNRGTAAESMEKTYREAPDSRTVEEELRRRGIDEPRIENLTAAFTAERSGDLGADLSALPWEKGRELLRETAGTHDAAPEDIDSLEDLHEKIRQGRTKGLTEDAPELEALEGKLKEIGATPEERMTALRYYLRRNEPELMREETSRKAAAETTLWREIQEGNFDAGAGGAEGRLALRERIGELALGKKEIGRLLREFDARFSKDQHPDHDLIRAVIAEQQRGIEDPVLQGKFRDSAVKLAARLPLEKTLTEAAEAIVALREELVTNRPDAYLGDFRAPTVETHPAWSGWTVNPENGTFEKASEKKDIQPEEEQKVKEEPTQKTTDKTVLEAILEAKEDERAARGKKEEETPKEAPAPDGEERKDRDSSTQ